MILCEAEAISSREIEEIDLVTVLVPVNGISQLAREHYSITQAGASAEVEHLRVEKPDLRLGEPVRFF